MFRSNVLHRFTRQLIATLCLLLALVMSSSIWSVNIANAQAISPDGIWTDTPQNRPAAQGERVIIPQKYRAVTLNVSALQQLLQATPLERSATAQSTQVIFSLPLPDGTSGRFRIVESPIMAPELAAKFPPRSRPMPARALMTLRPPYALIGRRPVSTP